MMDGRNTVTAPRGSVPLNFFGYRIRPPYGKKCTVLEDTLGGRESTMAVEKTIYRVHISLDYIKPEIWRRIETPDCDLATLHEIIQCGMGWENYHLWGFSVGKQYLTPDEPPFAEEFRLSDLRQARKKKFEYTYDFGDSWRHTIKLETMAAQVPDATYPRCVAGKGACPPEDCGGVYGYQCLVEKARKIDRQKNTNDEPVDEEEDDFLSDMIGRDLENIDLDAINRRLANIVLPEKKKRQKRRTNEFDYAEVSMKTMVEELRHILKFSISSKESKE